ncbi:MAG: hypothetical protein AAFQ98_23440, partial [Bacteroidota bacterium]
MAEKHYRSVAELIAAAQLPDILSPLQDSFEDLTKGLFYKNYEAAFSDDRSIGYYSLDLILFRSLQIPIGAVEGIQLLVNPVLGSTESTLPLKLDYRLDILRYLNTADLSQFSGTPRDFYRLIIKILDIDAESLLIRTLEAFGVDTDSIQTFAEDFATQYGESLSGITNVYELYHAIEAKGRDLLEVIFDLRVQVQGQDPLANLQQLFDELIGRIDLDELLELFIPVITTRIEDITLALTFPRKWLTPIAPADGYQGIEVPEDPNTPEGPTRPIAAGEPLP